MLLYCGVINFLIHVANVSVTRTDKSSHTTTAKFVVFSVLCLYLFSLMAVFCKSNTRASPVALANSTQALLDSAQKFCVQKCRTQAACSFLTRPSWFSDYRNAVHVEKYGQLVGIHFSLPFPLVCTHFYFALLVRTFGIYI